MPATDIYKMSMAEYLHLFCAKVFPNYNPLLGKYMSL